MTTSKETCEIIEDFWRAGNGDPTDSWQPYIDASNNAFADGASAVILTGREGVGKTQLFGGVQARSNPDYSIVDEVDSKGSASFRAEHTGSTIIHLDEASRLERADGLESLADDTLEAADQGVRSVVVFPSATYADRARISSQYQTALQARGVNYRNIGDVVETHVTDEKVNRILLELGSDAQLAEYINSNPPLKTLRMFSSILKSIDYDLELNGPGRSRNPFQHATPGWLETLLGETLVSETSYTTRGAFSEMNWSINPVGYANVGFYTQNLTTDASLDLYKLLDATPPQPGENPYDRPYDPYNKN